MANIALKIATARGDDRSSLMTLGIEVRLQSDAPTDPPRHQFVLNVPLAATAPQVQAAVSAQAQREYDAFQAAQAQRTRDQAAAAAAAAFVGTTYNITVT
jgi:hypothetical protein